LFWEGNFTLGKIDGGPDFPRKKKQRSTLKTNREEGKVKIKRGGRKPRSAGSEIQREKHRCIFSGAESAEGRKKGLSDLEHSSKLHGQEKKTAQGCLYFRTKNIKTKTSPQKKGEIVAKSDKKLKKRKKQVANAGGD